MPITTGIGIRSICAALLLLGSACTSRQPPSLSVLYHQGYQHLAVGELTAASRAAVQGKQLAANGRHADWIWAFDVLEDEILVGKRRIPAALQRLDRQLASPRARDAILARALMTRGYARCYSARGMGASGADDLRAASALARQLRSDALRVEVMLRRGTCRGRADDADNAEALFLAAFALAQQNGYRLLAAQALGNMGNLRIATSEYDDAVRWLTRSRQTATGLNAIGLQARNLGRLGWCYLQLGDYLRAAQVLNEAEPLVAASGHAGDRITMLQHLGQAYQRMERYSDAERTYERAIALARKLEDPRESARVLADLELNRAELAVESGQLVQAVSYADNALRIQLEQRIPDGRQRSLLLLGRIREKQNEPARAQALYREVLGLPVTRPELRWEAHALLARLLAHSGDNAQAEAQYRQAFALMRKPIAELLEPEHQLPFLASIARFQADYVDFLIKQGRVEDALRAAEANRASLLQARNSGTTTTQQSSTDYQQLAARANALLLFYSIGAERSYLWVIDAQRIKLVPLPGEATLEHLVDSHQRRILASRDPLAEGSADSVELYRLLVLPGIEALPPDRRVIIAADGPLLRLNFETLVVPDPQPHYLIEDAIITSALSLRSLPAKALVQPAQRRLLALGDPTAVDPDFPPLPFAQREIETVAAQFAPAQRLVRTHGDATPAAYRQAASGHFDYIHIAAHAQANTVAPLDSAIVLSADGSQYKLYARGLMQIPLDGALVSLSACRSAGTRAFSGQGLVGLSWAFLSAGARQVIGGLWLVEDRSTAQVMGDLYAQLARGGEPSAALREAKLQLLHSETAYGKPYYWAPFVIYSSGLESAPRPVSAAH